MRRLIQPQPERSQSRGRVPCALVDASGDQRSAIVHGVPGVADAERAIKRLKRTLESSRLIRVHSEERFTLAHRVTGLRVEVDSRSVLNRVLLARAACAQTPSGNTKWQCFLFNENTVTVGKNNVA